MLSSCSGSFDFITQPSLIDEVCQVVMSTSHVALQILDPLTNLIHLIPPGQLLNRPCGFGSHCFQIRNEHYLTEKVPPKKKPSGLKNEANSRKKFLEVGSKSKSVPIDPNVKMFCFTAAINSLHPGIQICSFGPNS